MAKLRVSATTPAVPQVRLADQSAERRKGIFTAKKTTCCVYLASADASGALAQCLNPAELR